jgi:hypothetical protein
MEKDEKSLRKKPELFQNGKAEMLMITSGSVASTLPEAYELISQQKMNSQAAEGFSNYRTMGSSRRKSIFVRTP